MSTFPPPGGPAGPSASGPPPNGDKQDHQEPSQLHDWYQRLRLFIRSRPSEAAIIAGCIAAVVFAWTQGGFGWGILVFAIAAIIYGRSLRPKRSDLDADVDAEVGLARETVIDRRRIVGRDLEFADVATWITDRLAENRFTRLTGSISTHLGASGRLVYSVTLDGEVRKVETTKEDAPVVPPEAPPAAGPPPG